MESLISFADNGLGGLYLISTFSRLADFLRGSAGRCYKRFINKMKCDAKKSYFYKMRFSLPHMHRREPTLFEHTQHPSSSGTPANPLLPSQWAGRVSSMQGKLLWSLPSHPIVSKTSLIANNCKCKHLKRCHLRGGLHSSPQRHERGFV